MDGLPPEVRRLFEELRTGHPRALPSVIPVEWWERETHALIVAGQKRVRRRRILAALALTVLTVVVAAAGLRLGLAL